MSVDTVVMRVLIVAVGIIGAVVSLEAKVRAWWAGEPLRCAGSIVEAEQAYAGVELAPGVAARYSGELQWVREDAPTWQWLLFLAPEIVTSLALGLGCVLVWQLVNRTAAGDAFGGRSVTLVRVLGVTVFGYGVVVPILRGSVQLVLTGEAMGESGQPGSALFGAAMFWPILVGLLLIVMAEVWRQGAKLRHDVAGLV